MSSIARPVTTSGSTIGAVMSSTKRVSPLKRPTRTKTKAAKVPITTEAHAVMKAMSSEMPTARMISAFWNKARYQRSEVSVQTVTMRESLNEYTIKVPIGRYKKIRAQITITARMSALLRSLVTCIALLLLFAF